jgi:hypothetical protein
MAKVPWRDFTWQLGKPDGELDDEELPHLQDSVLPHQIITGGQGKMMRMTESQGSLDPEAF